jgi:hypothetical protein
MTYRETLSLLHGLRRPTFFTRDADFSTPPCATRGIVWSGCTSIRWK